MIDAVFISDLHLHPEEAPIAERFERFIQWASSNTRAVYILGDFFHVWPGDDGLDAWSEGIGARLSWLASQGVTLSYMHGNRDFLLGPRFASLASMTLLREPTIITLGDRKVLLMHGDGYCIHDKAHQRLRRVTRNERFVNLFLKLPFSLRNKLVNTVREHSQNNRSKPAIYMDVVPSAMLNHMDSLQVRVLIHGHTHKPGLTTHDFKNEQYLQYVLSDWDDNPLLMCYDRANGFYFSPLI